MSISAASNNWTDVKSYMNQSELFFPTGIPSLLEGWQHFTDGFPGKVDSVSRDLGRSCEILVDLVRSGYIL